MARNSAFGMSPIPGYPRSIYQLERHAGGKNSKLAQLLMHLMNSDATYERYDFLEKALDTTNAWTATAGAGATAFAITAANDGMVRGVSGTTAATSGNQLFKANKNYSAGHNSGMEVAWRVDVITELRVEVGFMNALPAVNTNMTNSLTTPTVTTTVDGAWHVWDNASAVITQELITIGGTGTSPAKVVDVAPVALVAATYTTGTPLAGSTHVDRIQLNGTVATSYVNGIKQGQSLTNALASANALIWGFQCKISDTNQKNVDIDYVELWGDRSAY